MYLAPNEAEPIRKTKSKRHRKKVMFLVAVAKPRRHHNKQKDFDGKLG